MGWMNSTHRHRYCMRTLLIIEDPLSYHKTVLNIKNSPNYQKSLG